MGAKAERLGPIEGAAEEISGKIALKKEGASPSRRGSWWRWSDLHAWALSCPHEQWRKRCEQRRPLTKTPFGGRFAADARGSVGSRSDWQAVVMGPGVRARVTAQGGCRALGEGEYRWERMRLGRAVVVHQLGSQETQGHREVPSPGVPGQGPFACPSPSSHRHFYSQARGRY